MTKDTDSPPAPGVREAAQELIDARDACATHLDADDPANYGRIERVQTAWANLRRALAAPVEPQSPGVPREPTPSGGEKP